MTSEKYQLINPNFLNPIQDFINKNITTSAISRKSILITKSISSENIVSTEYNAADPNMIVFRQWICHIIHSLILGIETPRISIWSSCLERSHAGIMRDCITFSSINTARINGIAL